MKTKLNNNERERVKKVRQLYKDGLISWLDLTNVIKAIYRIK